MFLIIENLSAFTLYRALDEIKDTWTEAEWVTAFSEDVMLLKRPIFVKDGVAIAVGFRDVAKIKASLLPS